MASTTIVQGAEVADYPTIPAEADRGRVLRVTEVGEDVLHHPCRPVTEFGTEELRTLVDDMFATMLIAEGVGLAANQVGVDLKLFVYDLTTDDGVRYVGHVCNPVIEVLGEETEEIEEGCLSVPGPGVDLFRPLQVRLTGADIEGEPLSYAAEGYLARCFQHESDHLNGRLYIDLISKRSRKRVLKDMAELRPEVLDRRAELTTTHGKEPVAYPDQPNV
ncbi:peptide deformylase [Ruania zhangjianzhongii]|uniref:peptide deformylase n=1 Tax=Ruania zhangjianzhongii TaxID=2603206 RepID=UPI001F432A40|nr:peptide deformylase [Ruania zhangjianzhongii]